MHNRVGLESLEIQHRMRPDIADLVRWIYTEAPVSGAAATSEFEVGSPSGLIDHENVKLYEHLRGIAHDLFFLHHDNPEQEDPDTFSHYNKGLVSLRSFLFLILFSLFLIVVI